MSTNVSSVTKHFPKAQNGFQTTLASTISAGAATVPLNSVAGYTNGDTIVLVVDPTSSAKQTFTGVVDTSGVQLTNVVWTAGTNVTHSGGATVVDYFTATHISMMSKGMLVSHNQDGSLLTSAVRTALNLDSGTSTGWTVLGYTPSTITALGNRSYSMVFNGNDLTSTVSPGMRLRMTRTVAAPTRCSSLNGTTQYYSKSSPAGMTFTDDFAVSAWVKLSSYGSAQQTIASRYNGTSGWEFAISASGQVTMTGYNGSAANFSYVQSNQSVPLNKWVHVAAQLDMSAFTATTTTSYTMIDGVDVPASLGRAGTNPTALVQAGNLEIGARNGGLLPIASKLGQVAIYSAKVTQATILASMHQTLSGSETSLISAYSFNGIITDLNTSNANNLTANGSAVATNADSPYGGQGDGTISSTVDFGINMAQTFSTNTTLTVQAPEGCTIPTTGGVSAVSYSTQKVPFGFPSARGKWTVSSLYLSTATQNPVVTSTWYNVGSSMLQVPIGEWQLKYQTNAYIDRVAAGSLDLSVTFSTGAASETEKDMTSNVFANGNTAITTPVSREKAISVSTATPYYLNSRSNQASAVNLQQHAGGGLATAECAHL